MIHTAAGKTESRLDRVLKVLQEPEFMQRTGHGNELAFHVFDYPPEDELLVRDRIAWFQGNLSKNVPGIQAIFFDLYEEILEILADRGILDKLPAMEEKDPAGYAGVLSKLHRGPLHAENVAHHLLKKIKDEHNLIVLTGVGKAYPLLRSHSILNNLHHPLPEKTLLLFFPGGYDQRELRLFCRMKDDNYYRAFRLVGDK